MFFLHFSCFQHSISQQKCKIWGIFRKAAQETEASQFPSPPAPEPLLSTAAPAPPDASPHWDTAAYLYGG